MNSFFDDYTDPQTFGGVQGAQAGLIDDLLKSVAATPTPSAGFPAAPMDANAAIPAPAPQPQQASPIDVGGYQMPRIGPAAAFTPPQINPSTGEAVTPQPAAAPLQQPAAQPAAPAAPTFLDTARSHLDTAAASMDHGGGLIGGLTSLVTGQRHDPVARLQADQQVAQQKQVQQLSAALTGRGIPADQALQLAKIHAIDKEAGKALIEKALGPPQAAPQYAWDPKTGKAVHLYEPEQKDNFTMVQTGENGLGVKQFSKMNKATGELTPIGAAPGADNGGGLGDMNLNGKDYLATLDPKTAGVVKAVAEGRQAIPGGPAGKSKYWTNIIPAVQQYDPTFDATNYNGRVAGVKDFSSGKSSEMVRSANQTLHHVNALIDSADALHNGSYPSMNWVGNKLAEATGAGEPGAFVMNAHAVADEMGKVFKGANLSDSEIHAWADALSPNMSPAQQRAAVGKMTELLHGALDALDEKRVSSIGQVAADKAGPIIKPEGQAVLKRIDSWLKAGNAPGGAAGGTAPTGVKWSVVQ
jgi:hypothetical protein